MFAQWDVWPGRQSGAEGSLQALLSQKAILAAQCLCFASLSGFRQHVLSLSFPDVQGQKAILDCHAGDWHQLIQRFVVRPCRLNAICCLDFASPCLLDCKMPKVESYMKQDMN